MSEALASPTLQKFSIKMMITNERGELRGEMILLRAEKKNF